MKFDQDGKEGEIVSEFLPYNFLDIFRIQNVKVGLPPQT